MRTVVLWDGVPGAAGEVLSLRKAKQPARTSENQTNVRSAGRQTIAITTLLNMALASPGWNPSTQRSLHETARRFPIFLGLAGREPARARQSEHGTERQRIHHASLARADRLRTFNRKCCCLFNRIGIAIKGARALTLPAGMADCQRL